MIETPRPSIVAGLTKQVEAAGLTVTTSRIEAGTYAAPSIDAAVANEIESTPYESASATRFDANLVVARRP